MGLFTPTVTNPPLLRVIIPTTDYSLAAYYFLLVPSTPGQRCRPASQPSPTHCALSLPPPNPYKPPNKKRQKYQTKLSPAFVRSFFLCSLASPIRAGPRPKPPARLQSRGVTARGLRPKGMKRPINRHRSSTNAYVRTSCIATFQPRSNQNRPLQPTIDTPLPPLRV